MKQILQNLLAYPSTAGLDLDDPRLTDLRREVIREKPFLRLIYQEWYQEMIRFIPNHSAAVLELGSGAGFMKDLYQNVIQSEIFWIPGLDMVLDGCNLPFKNDALKAILMVDVLHHIPQVRGFFIEASRCLVDGGKIIMIEPWVTSWSRLIYQRLHHEPFQPEAPQWSFPSTGPLSGANGALPWMIFERDYYLFHQEFPQFTVEFKRVFMPFRYLVSGGVSMRSFTPNWSFSLWKGFENLINPWMNQLGMFAVVVIRNSKSVTSSLTSEDHLAVNQRSLTTEEFPQEIEKWKSS